MFKLIGTQYFFLNVALYRQNIQCFCAKIIWFIGNVKNARYLYIALAVGDQSIIFEFHEYKNFACFDTFCLNTALIQ